MSRLPDLSRDLQHYHTVTGGSRHLQRSARSDVPYEAGVRDALITARPSIRAGVPVPVATNLILEQAMNHLWRKIKMDGGDFEMQDWQYDLFTHYRQRYQNENDQAHYYAAEMRYRARRTHDGRTRDPQWGGAAGVDIPDENLPANRRRNQRR
jgi:hypothetical protein